MKEIIYKSILIKESDNLYLGFNPSKEAPGFLVIEWNKELPEDTENLIYSDGELIKRPQAELDTLQAAIDNQKEVDELQDKVVARLAGAVNSILKFIEAKNTLTSPQKKIVNDFCNDYKAWVDRL